MEKPDLLIPLHCRLSSTNLDPCFLCCESLSITVVFPTPKSYIYLMFTPVLFLAFYLFLHTVQNESDSTLIQVCYGMVFEFLFIFICKHFLIDYMETFASSTTNDMECKWLPKLCKKKQWSIVWVEFCPRPDQQL